jgi:hypothetical protein
MPLSRVSASHLKLRRLRGPFDNFTLLSCSGQAKNEPRPETPSSRELALSAEGDLMPVDIRQRPNRESFTGQSKDTRFRSMKFGTEGTVSV